MEGDQGGLGFFASAIALSWVSDPSTSTIFSRQPSVPTMSYLPLPASHGSWASHELPFPVSLSETLRVNVGCGLLGQYESHKGLLGHRRNEEVKSALKCPERLVTMSHRVRTVWI
jgi:hypothetical protein